MELITLIGLAATVVSGSRSLPQLVRTLRIRDTSGLTPATAGCTAISAAGWGSYALTVGDTTLLATSGATAFGAGLLAVLLARLGGMPEWSKRTMVLWGVLLVVIASIGGATVLAGALTTGVIVNAIPQIRTILANPDASGVSVSGWAIAGVEGLLWAAYGVVGGNLSLGLWGLVALVPALVVLSIVVPQRAGRVRGRTPRRVRTRDAALDLAMATALTPFTPGRPFPELVVR